MVALKFEGDMVASQIMKLVGFIYANLSGYSTLAWATTIAGVFVAISVSVSMFLLFHHLSAYKNPEEQKFLIGVILMVPCYAVESMGIASIVHIYVFPAKPYELMGDRLPGTVSVLGNYASVDFPFDPDEVRDSVRPTKLRIPQPPDVDFKSGMNIKESVRDVFLGGGEYIVNDLKFIVTHAVEPMEKGLTRFNEKLHKISQNIKKQEKEGESRMTVS